MFTQLSNQASELIRRVQLFLGIMSPPPELLMKLAVTTANTRGLSSRQINVEDAYDLLHPADINCRVESMCLLKDTEGVAQHEMVGMLVRYHDGREPSSYIIPVIAERSGYLNNIPPLTKMSATSRAASSSASDTFNLKAKGHLSGQNNTPKPADDDTKRNTDTTRKEPCIAYDNIAYFELPPETKYTETSLPLLAQMLKTQHPRGSDCSVPDVGLNLDQLKVN